MTPYHEEPNTKIYCGDNVAVTREAIKTASIDLTVTSPPYDNLRDYKGYTWDFEALAAELWRVTKPGGVVVWVVGDATIDGSETGTSFRQALYFMGLGFRLHDTMIYKIKGTTQQRPVLRYGACWEYMFVFSKDRPKTLNIMRFPKTNKTKKRTKKQKNGSTLKGTFALGGGPLPNVWEYQVGKNGEDDTPHDAPFPEALARDHIKSWSNPGDLVFDPFLGSGTTAKMAKKLDRNFVGIELSQDYCNIAIDRLNIARADMGQAYEVAPGATQSSMF